MAIERIEVHGVKLAGGANSWSILCRGMGCKSAAASLQLSIDSLLKENEEYVEQEKAELLFCAKLKSNKPSHCNLMFGTPVPGPYLQDSSYFWNIPPTTNGCGTGSFAEWLLTKGLKGTNGFTGNLDEPLLGYSFKNACNNHDLCYSASSGQRLCDTSFHSEMNDVCNSNYDCETFAGTFAYSVRLLGKDAYDKAGKTQKCREFKADMEDNKCMNSSGISDI